MKRVAFVILMALSTTSIARSPLLPQIGPSKIDLADLLFVGLLGEAVLSATARMRRDRRLARALVVCLAFFIVLAIGSAVAYLNGTPLIESTDNGLGLSVLAVLRHWIYIPGIFLVAMSRPLTSTNVESEARWLVLLGTASAAVDMLDLSFLWTGLRSEPLVVNSEYVLRRPGGGVIVRALDQALLLVAAAITLALMGEKRTVVPQRLRYISPALLFGAIAMTQAKYMVVATGIAFLADLLMARQVKAALSKITAAGLAAGVAAVILWTVGAFHGAAQQFEELFIPQSYASDLSVVWRLVELRYAFRAFIESPLVGFGVGSPYRPMYVPEANDAFSDLLALNYYVHNFYAWLLVDTGLIGLAVFLWFLAQPFRYIPQVARTSDAPIYRAALVALVACLMALSVAPVDNYGFAFILGFLVALGVRAGEVSRGSRTTA